MPGSLCLVGRRAFLDDEMAKQEPQDDNRKLLLLELNKEDSPRLIAGEWTELFDFFNLSGGLGLEAEFFWLVVEGQVFNIIRFNRPIEFIAKILYK